MNQTEQILREALRLLREIHPGNMTPMAEESWKNATVLIEQVLANKPSKLVRLTEEEVSKIENRIWANTIDKGGLMALFIQRFSKAIQDTLEAKNGGKSDGR